jgi:hypothetical protein
MDEKLRTGNVIGNVWKCLEKNGYYTSYLVCDEGKGLCTAKDEALPVQKV